ncbi:hypothetical protein BJF87_08285 [Gordonia sp. CNJ-863]|nr:hypothetical protein BJF87_08285 [Gordonia sp. CNJ-863]
MVQPDGFTSSCLATSATKIFAFCSPKPGRSRRRFIRSAPLLASVQMREASPPYSSATTFASACTRPAIERP